MDYQEIHNPCYFGRGRVHFGAPLQPMEPDGVDRLPPGRFIGNARTFSIEPQVDALETTAWDTRSNLVVRGIAGRLELYGHGGANLAAVLNGTHIEAVGLAREDVVPTSRLSLPADSMLFTQRMIDPTRDVRVRPSWISWTEGVHWARESYGVRLLAGFSAPSGSSISLEYTSAGGAQEISGAATPASELSVVYTGINRADGAATRVEAYRCRPALDGGISVISDGAGVLVLSLNILPVRVSVGTTRWYRAMRAPHIAGHHVQ
ncbi:hypothetical protein [Achromobacter insolitus]|uniref:hypothetical protein n=1 Tax=Achromobacter insolitus TaxID=217204 RepID=UPI001EED1EDE|nr:hypothetical protein [Achromobacter insolitus]